MPRIPANPQCTPVKLPKPRWAWRQVSKESYAEIWEAPPPVADPEGSEYRVCKRRCPDRYLWEAQVREGPGSPSWRYFGRSGSTKEEAMLCCEKRGCISNDYRGDWATNPPPDNRERADEAFAALREKLPPAPEGYAWKEVSGLWAVVPLPPADVARIDLDKRLAELVKNCADAGVTEEQGSGAACKDATHFLIGAPALFRREFVEYLRKALNPDQIGDASPADDGWYQGRDEALAYVDKVLEGLLK